ncbi:MAG TPA: ATP-binding protein [Flavobacteriales bacterium]|nr:ATP-binding protein [Flavobacteriales bacterium]
MNVSYNASYYTVPLVAGTLLFAALAFFIIYFIFAYKKAHQKFEWEREKFKQALLQAEIEIKEYTLKHISRELHDNLGQIASLVKINLNMLAAGAGEKDKERINETLDLLRQMIQDIKTLSVSLNNEDLGSLRFMEAVEKDVLRVSKLKNINISCESEGNFPVLKPGVEVFLYRMFQEMLSNALRHANATRVRLLVNVTKNNLTLTFSDDGKGFDREAALGKGSGLANLAERCRLIGAEMSMVTKPAKGTTIQIILPLQQ